MLKRLTCGASIAALALGLATSASFAEDKPVDGVLLKTLSNPFWGAMEQEIRDGAQAAGCGVFSCRPSNPTRRRSRSSIPATPCWERKPAVMITAAINSTILLPRVKQANDMGMPVVDLDANLDHAIAAKAGVKIAFTHRLRQHCRGGPRALITSSASSARMLRGRCW